MYSIKYNKTNDKYDLTPQGGVTEGLIGFFKNSQEILRVLSVSEDESGVDSRSGSVF